MTKPAKLVLGIGAAGMVLAVTATIVPGPPRWIALWIATSCFVAAGAYAWNRPGVFGKRDGRLSPLRVLPSLPYLSAFWFACWIMRTWRRTPAVSRVAPDLWVAGRITAADLPDGVDWILDLTCEFTEDPDVRSLPGYRCVPVLDGSVPPDEGAFLGVIDEFVRRGGGVLIHCDSGRGRAPTAAAALLVCRGESADVETALEVVRRGRRVSSPTVSDRRFLARIAPRLAERSAAREGSAARGARRRHG